MSLFVLVMCSPCPASSFPVTPPPCLVLLSSSFALLPWTLQLWCFCDCSTCQASASSSCLVAVKSGTVSSQTYLFSRCVFSSKLPYCLDCVPISPFLSINILLLHLGHPSQKTWQWFSFAKVRKPCFLCSDSQRK